MENLSIFGSHLKKTLVFKFEKIGIGNALAALQPSLIDRATKKIERYDIRRCKNKTASLVILYKTFNHFIDNELVILGSTQLNVKMNKRMIFKRFFVAF